MADSKLKHPASAALGILLSGNPLLADGEEYWYQDGVFGVRRERHNENGTKEEIILGVDMSIAAFIQWCDKIPEEAIFRSIFNKVVQQNRRKR